ncbi:phage head-tail joining protein [Kaistia sp. MMO-174]|uniref:phage head-tail joining protein n=1 Tax=Kaistia sp. MMO-174 TaxID=3081256 RepID=UPI003018CF69
MSIAEEVAALREAIASGTKRVRTKTNGVEREVEYPSFDDLKKRLDYLNGLDAAQSGRPLSRVSLATFSKGR